MGFSRARSIIDLRVFIQKPFFFSCIWRFLLSFCLFFLPPTQGLCGNFNNIQTDDFRTVTGAVEDSASAFGNSWKTRASCFDVEDSFEDPCSNSVDKGTRLFIPDLSVRNNFHMMDNQKKLQKSHKHQNPLPLRLLLERKCVLKVFKRTALLSEQKDSTTGERANTFTDDLKSTHSINERNLRQSILGCQYLGKFFIQSSLLQLC